ncbi:MAG TPA: sigma factor-like helix-turn-helix DNA-binding protein [Solirubrobacteraceae bacterium]|jgi:hypothetical protein|nr:sigma factor-like helix-turn-helix DNA-binding protein [Solirubrobacteraceae bacterium]
MDEVLQFCTRVLIDPALAAEAHAAALAESPNDRLTALAAAGRACRERATLVAAPAAINGSVPTNGTLSGEVTFELGVACAQLAERHRETLALRELLGLSYDEIAAVIRVEPAAVGPLLARARLRLRTALHGPVPAGGDPCEVRDRALRALARRQDAQPMSAEDEDWLLAHLGTCEQCNRAHAAMLEASACYRAWSPAVAPSTA